MPSEPATLYTVLTAYAPIAALFVSAVIVPLLTHWLNGKKIETVRAQVVEVQSSVGEVKKDVAKVEKSTNSMKDELVKATADAAKEAGKAEERAVQARLEAARIKGSLEVQQMAAPSFPPKPPTETKPPSEAT